MSELLAYATADLVAALWSGRFGQGASIHLSQWFLLIAAFGSLFMAAGKRYAELKIALDTGAKIPFTIAILRYAVDVDGAGAGEPEEIVLGDRTLQSLALACAATIGVAVYLT